ncbi:MAG TPA: hypothetical protein VMV27_15770 [Candidatus Binataceae bacterium]|nr:hypothetical protein [Candidatus Binataceae bacterium]
MKRHKRKIGVMRCLARMTILVFLGFLACSPSALLAAQIGSGVTIVSSKAEIESRTCFRFDETARMEESPRAVFDAFTRIDQWGGMRPLRVIGSPDHRSTILEFDFVLSHAEPPRGQGVVYQRQFLFDPQKLTVSVQWLNDRPIPLGEHYQLSPLGDGTGTLVKYRGSECIPDRPSDDLGTAEGLERQVSSGLKRTLEDVERDITFKAPEGAGASPHTAPLNADNQTSPSAFATPPLSQR